jgi:thiol:disulfide interchange protein
MYLYYAAIAILLILIIFPSVRKSLVNLIFSSPSKEEKVVSKNKKVQENFNSKFKKVVFTSYTADWCPHCVTFKSQTYGDLYNMFKGDKRIVIQNIDCTNDRSGNTKTMAGNAIDGYPTLMVNTYDANNNMTENTYNGARDANSIAEYLRGL